LGEETALAPWLLLAALLLAFADLLIALMLRGLLPIPRTAAIALVGLVIAPGLARGQEDAGDLQAQLVAETRLAYVRTGIAEVDRLSEAGLIGLSLVLARRTAVEPAEPVGVNVAEDELALFPLLYWPVPPEHPDLPEGALERVDDYLRQGGMILFDTADAARLLPGEAGGGPGEQRLAELLRGLDLPPLVPVPPDHALTRAFYLLQDFPGRFTGQTVWVDEAPAGLNDGVSSVVIGANDWAGAWAVDELGNPLLPVIPGGERQRVAVARALVLKPTLLLADEPTGNLDADTGNDIVRILRELNQQDGLTIVMVTHNMELAASCDRIVRLAHGRIERSALAV
jgi:hypothetical protein